MNGTVLAVSASRRHAFSKPPALAIELIAGQGVAGDAHAGPTVMHRSRVARDPTQPNLRQVHLLHAELFDELRANGYDIAPGDIGENITTRSLDLLGLPVGARLSVGPTAIVEITGLRNPCIQLDKFRPGLMAATLGRDATGGLVRKAGVMSIVRVGGLVQAGDRILGVLPTGPHRPLGVV